MRLGFPILALLIVAMVLCGCVGKTPPPSGLSPCRFSGAPSRATTPMFHSKGWPPINSQSGFPRTGAGGRSWSAAPSPLPGSGSMAASLNRPERWGWTRLRNFRNTTLCSAFFQPWETQQTLRKGLTWSQVSLQEQTLQPRRQYDQAQPRQLHLGWVSNKSRWN